MTSSSSFIFSPLQDQNFAMCITPQDLILPFYNIQRRNYFRPWKWCTQNDCKNIGSTIVDDKENFKIILDIEGFRENEINVRVTESEIIIIGEHEERQDEHGLIAKKFKRRYIVPSCCSLNNVTCTLSTDGILTVNAAKKSLRNVKDKEKNVLIKLCDAYKEINQVENTIGTEIEQYSVKQETEDNSNKEKQIMLKEDSSCLLKTELLGGAYSAFQEVSNTIEKPHSDFDAEVDGLMNARCEIVEQAKQIVSEFLEESLGTSDVVASPEQLETNDSNLQQFQSNDFATLETFNSAATEQLPSTSTDDANVSEITKANMTNVTSSEVMALELEVSNITENTDINTMKEMEQYSTASLEKCKEDMMSAEYFTECLEQSNTTMSTLSLSENTEQSSTSTIEHSDQLNTFATTSKTSTSKAIVEQDSMHELSTSIKAASEELNDFITDVIAELREATENL